MNKNCYALTVYPLWEAEDILVMEIGESRNIKELSDVIEVCSKIYHAIAEVEELDINTKVNTYYDVMLVWYEKAVNIYNELSKECPESEYVDILCEVIDLIHESLDRYYLFSVI